MISILAALTISTATAAPDEQQLKKEFLLCDSESSEFMLDDASGAYCSAVYETLKKKVFNNNSTELLEWWQTQKKTSK